MKKIVAILVVLAIFLSLPAAFAWYTPSWSLNGKILQINYVYKDPSSLSYINTYATYNPSGTTNTKTVEYTKEGIDSFGRKIKVVTKDLWTATSGGLINTDRSKFSQIGLSKGYSFKSNGKYSFNYVNGYLYSSKGSESIYGNLPGGYTYSGTRTSYGSVFYGQNIYPKIIYQLTVKKNGAWHSNVKITSIKKFDRLGGRNALVYDKITTNTKFSKGAYRNSTITTNDQYETNGKYVSTTISGYGKGLIVINGKKIYYKSKIYIPASVTSTGNTKIKYYKETKYSKYSKLPKNIPYEAMFYKEIHQTE